MCIRDSLATDDQFLPLSGHYLKVFKEKIAHFLLLKSVTQTNYFSQIITQYQMSKPVVYDDPKMDPMNNEAYDKAEFLNLLIQEAQKELGS